MNTKDIIQIASECGAVNQFGYKSQPFYCMSENELITFTKKITANIKEELHKEIDKMKSDSNWGEEIPFDLLKIEDGTNK